MITITQAFATLLGIAVDQTPAGPIWIQKCGPLVTALGSIYDDEKNPFGLRLKDAVHKAMANITPDTECEYIVLPAKSPRAQIYIEIEGETLRQEKNEGEKLSKSIAGNDPRDALTLVMEQYRECAMSLSNPALLVINFRRSAVLSIAAYEWAINWFATLQVEPLGGSIGAPRRFSFPHPPTVIPTPPPLAIEPPPAPPVSEPDPVDSGFDVTEAPPKEEA